MKKYVVLILLSGILSVVKSQTVFIADTGEITFYSYALIEDITAKSNQVNSIYNSVSGEIAFMIPIRSFHFAKSLMQEHFNEKYMESDKYPHATFKGTVNEKIDISKPGIYHVTAKGNLAIHGIEKEVNETGEMEVGKNDITIKSRFFVALADYNIVKPKLVFNNIADTIEVNINATYIPYKKK